MKNDRSHLKSKVNHIIKHEIGTMILTFIFLILTSIIKKVYGNIYAIIAIFFIFTIFYFVLSINSIKFILDYCMFDIVKDEGMIIRKLTTGEKYFRKDIFYLQSKGKKNKFSYAGDLSYKNGDYVKIHYLKRSKYVIECELIKNKKKKGKLT